MGQNYMLVNALGGRVTSMGSNGYFRTREYADITARVANSGRTNIQWHHGLPFLRNQPNDRGPNGELLGMGYHAWVRVGLGAQAMIHDRTLSGLMAQYEGMFGLIPN